MTDATSRRAVFATAGHVDHGKTALVRALTGTDTDRLPEEKRRGISIELGFAELRGEAISFIDVPGHRRLVHAMIAGVGGVDALVLVVAADDGVMPQTREHLSVANLLGVERVVVALTKADLVDRETLELAETDVREALAAVHMSPIAVVPTSAVDGTGVDELRRILSTLARSLPASANTERAFLSVDRVFSVKGSGTVVTGTLTRGRLHVGRTLYVAGPDGERETTCRKLEIHGESVATASAPTRVAVNLARLDKNEVRRGDVVTTLPHLPITRRFDATFRALPDKDVEAGDVVIVHVGTTRAEGRIFPLSSGVAHVTLGSAVPCVGGEGFVVRGFSPDQRSGAVLGGGRVLDAEPSRLPPNRDRSERERRARWLELGARGDVVSAAREIVDAAAPKPVAVGALEQRLGAEPRSLEAALAAGADAGHLVRVSELAFTSKRGLSALSDEIVERVRAEEAAAPHELGVSVETLRSAFEARAGRDATDLALAGAASDGRLRMLAGGLVCTPEFAETRGKGLSAEAKRVLGALEAEPLEGLAEKDLESKTGLSAAALRGALGRLSRDGTAHRLSGLWFAESAIEALRRRVIEHFRTTPTLTIQTLKDLAGVSRKQAIPLMEQLDREGTTRRVGDARVLGPGRIHSAR